MDSNHTILLVDDDRMLSSMTAEFLQAKGLTVDVFHDAHSGLDAFKAGDYAVCILDVRMPMKDGFSLAEDIRATDAAVPFIFLTGNVDKEDRIKGLTLGADDYITKPFSMEELFLRIKVALRRSGQTVENSRFELGDYVYDSKSRTLTMSVDTARLSEAEGKLLTLFLTQPDGLVTRDLALRKVWGDEDHLKTRSLNVYINKLRKRLEGDPNIEIINVYGTGYKLVR